MSSHQNGARYVHWWLHGGDQLTLLFLSTLNLAQAFHTLPFSCFEAHLPLGFSDYPLSPAFLIAPLQRSFSSVESLKFGVPEGSLLDCFFTVYSFPRWILILPWFQCWKWYAKPRPLLWAPDPHIQLLSHHLHLDVWERTQTQHITTISLPCCPLLHTIPFTELCHPESPLPPLSHTYPINSNSYIFPKTVDFFPYPLIALSLTHHNILSVLLK